MHHASFMERVQLFVEIHLQFPTELKIHYTDFFPVEVNTTAEVYEYVIIFVLKRDQLTGAGYLKVNYIVREARRK